MHLKSEKQKPNIKKATFYHLNINPIKRKLKQKQRLHTDQWMQINTIPEILRYVVLHLIWSSLTKRSQIVYKLLYFTLPAQTLAQKQSQDFKK